MADTPATGDPLLSPLLSGVLQLPVEPTGPQDASEDAEVSSPTKLLTEAMADTSIDESTEPAAAAPVEQIREGVTFKDGQLFCVGLDLPSIPQWLGEEYGATARRVDMCYNQLQDLTHLQAFTVLEELILDNNLLGDDVEFPVLPLLTTLTLNKNNISSLDAFLENAKRSFPQLKYLSLLGNSACPNELVAKDEDDYQRYRYYVLFMLPRLKFLDSRPVTAKELQEAMRVGQFTKVVRISDDELASQIKRQSTGAGEASSFSPLSRESRTAEQPRATIGTCKYVYYGRHSEGNRFIRNNDL